MLLSSCWSAAALAAAALARLCWPRSMRASVLSADQFAPFSRSRPCTPTPGAVPPVSYALTRHTAGARTGWSTGGWKSSGLLALASQPRGPVSQDSPALLLARFRPAKKRAGPLRGPRVRPSQLERQSLCDQERLSPRFHHQSPQSLATWWLPGGGSARS